MTPTVTSREDYEKLFNVQVEKLRRMAYYFLREAGAAEDAVQETFTRGLANLHGFRGESKIEVWLYSIALNVCRQAYRKARIEEDLSEDVKSKQRSKARGPLSTLIRRETASQLAIALGYLTDLQREVFILHYVEELPYEELAPVIGISVVGARGLAHRAKQTLRSKLPPAYALPGGA